MVGRPDRPGRQAARPGRPIEILRDIVEPGAEISNGKPFVQVETTSGESFTAIREEEGDAHVRVHDLSTTPPVLRRLPKAEIARIEPLSGSAMPSDLWQSLGAKELLDLVFYVRSKGAPESALPEVATRPVDIWSDGTRLSGDLFYPTGRTDKLPAIVMSHGWGGLRSHLNEAYAPYFAAEGFVVLTFDYRGWGESDGRLIFEPTAVRSRRPRGIDRHLHALHFIEGEEIVDPERIGYWGSSYSGGHAVWVAAHDPRVKAIVAQVPAMDSAEFVAAMDGGLEGARRQEIRRARGEIPPAPVDAPPLGELKGHPYASRMARYSPRAVANRVQVPTSSSTPEQELYREHGRRSRDSEENAPEVHIFIHHTGIYRGARGDRPRHQWFREHLKEKRGQSR
jgi:pimeloyl-ACP methyl ester carboxylesterase